MSTASLNSLRLQKFAPLTICLATALGLTLSTAHARGLPQTQHLLAAEGPHASFASGHRNETHGESAASTRGRISFPKRPASILSVDTCADDGSPGSLRKQIQVASDKDIINLANLPCSRITLEQGAISISQPNLYLQGPPGGGTPLTIDGNHNSPVFSHVGIGNFGLTDLNVENGSYVSAMFPEGGCVFSSGSVSLAYSVVSHCTLTSTSNSIAARGAGIYAHGNLSLYYSTISDSHVFAPSGARAKGGAAYVNNYFEALDSTISESTAFAIGGGVGLGGGVVTLGGVDIEASTISGNQADFFGGVAFAGLPPSTATIINSTISGNIGVQGAGGIYSTTPLSLISSTVAFNRSPFELYGYSEGVYARLSLTLQSSIIADNGGPNGPSDLGGIASIIAPSADNLIVSSTIPLPSGTISDCPKLGPLADNDGPTHTHALGATSAAIDKGDAGILQIDQRFAPRVAGGAADIGSFELQPTDKEDRVLIGGFDGPCEL